MKQPTIDKICKNVLNITDDSFKEAREMARKQMQYISPLKPATQAKSNSRGRRNNEILDKLVELKELIVKNKPED